MIREEKEILDELRDLDKQILELVDAIAIVSHSVHEKMDRIIDKKRILLKEKKMIEEKNKETNK